MTYLHGFTYIIYIIVHGLLPYFVFLCVVKDYVLKSLSNLDPHKSTGLDGLSSKILKLAAPVISSHLTSIFNQSISSGVFPSQWKISRITPGFKSGSHMDPNNYRPISILSIASKLLERHICQHIYNFFSSYDLLYKAQSGFRPHHSCETALIRLIDMWHKNIEEGQLNGFVLIDFHKVFDMINIDLLLSKLKLYQFELIITNSAYGLVSYIYQLISGASSKNNC